MGKYKRGFSVFLTLVAGILAIVAAFLYKSVPYRFQPVYIMLICAAVIAAEVGDPDRFDEPKKLMAYAGMESSKSQSGKFDGDRQHMSKRGSAPLRDALMTAADKARQRDPYFGDYYDSLVARGKHHCVAVSGCARKLCGVILAVLRERRPYEPRPSIQSQQKQPEKA